MQNSTDERRKSIHEFLNFTGTTDEDRALSYLDTANWDLPEAVQLFYAQQVAAETTDIGASTTAAGDEEEDEDEDVRPPLPSKHERLVDRDGQFDHLLHRKPKQTPIYEAFRNHTAELAEYEHGPNAEGGTKGLARLYKAPIEILFRKGFDEAKDKAAKEDTWLMINVQSTNEFASHQLNRDTFSNNALKEMIKANFIFLQTYNYGITGRKLTSFYKLETFPCVLVIDPITGELMRCFTGFVEANRLIEDLVEFMDCRPTDGTASRLVRRHHKDRETEDAQEGTPVAEAGVHAEESAKRKTEEDLLYASGGSQGSEEDGTEDGGEPRHVAQRLKEASPSPQAPSVRPAVPLAPPAAGDDTCTVGILLPDGRRLQRRFYKHDTVEGLYGFCNSEFDEAKSKPYKLKPRMPGSQFLEDLSDTLESARVHDCLLALVWDT